VDPRTWSWLAGGLLVLLGLVQLFPTLWDRASAALRLQDRSTRRLGAARERDGWTGALLTGAALGPVFTSCSPLYGYVVVTVLPAEPARGSALLLGYVVGLCGTLLLIALGGATAVRRMGWLADPHGWPRRLLGLVFVGVGLVVALGWDRELQAWLIENAPVRPWELDRGFIPQ
jgi:cytochrome c-type biogenesis protein